jgi:hypothetical protein
MRTLPAAFLKKLAARLDDENTLGVALSGSFARGEGGRFSDVDLWHFVRQQPVGGGDLSGLDFVDGILVSVKTTLLEKDYARLQNPRQAIWVIPAWRQAQILLDKEGALAAMKETAQGLSWESLQPAANAFASRDLAGMAEEVHKILGGLAQRNESKTLYAMWGLTQEMANALLVQRGVLIPTENAYIEYAQAAAGWKSAWTCQFRLAIGLDPLPPGDPAFVGLGIAGLRLYRETVSLLREILRPEDACIVDRTLEIMAEAGY